MSRDQNAGRTTHSIKTDNSSFERVEKLKYLGTTLTNQHVDITGSKQGHQCLEAHMSPNVTQLPVLLTAF